MAFTPLNCERPLARPIRTRPYRLANILSPNLGALANAYRPPAPFFRVPFQFMRVFAILAAVALIAGCGSKSSSMEDLTTRDIVLPRGQVVRVEAMIDAK